LPLWAPKEPVQNEEKKNTRSIKEESSSFFSNLGNYIPQIIVGIIVVVIIGVIAFGMMHRSSSSSNVTIPKDNTEKTTKKSSSDTSKKSTKKAAKKTPAKKSTELTVKESDTKGTYTITNLPTDGTDVEVSADNGQAWIQFEEGSNTTWQQALSAGEKKSTKITSDITTFSIHTGNINNTKVSIGGKTVDLSSVSSGDSIVQTLTFNVESK